MRPLAPISNNFEDRTKSPTMAELARIAEARRGFQRQGNTDLGKIPGAVGSLLKDLLLTGVDKTFGWPKGSSGEWEVFRKKFKKKYGYEPEGSDYTIYPFPIDD